MIATMADIADAELELVTGVVPACGVAVKGSATGSATGDTAGIATTKIKSH
jgi:hypothetical protein